MNLNLLINHLKEESKRGVSHAYIDSESRMVIKTLVQQAKVKKQPTKPQVALPRKPTASYTTPPAQPLTQTRPQVDPQTIPQPVEIDMPEGSKVLQLKYLKGLSENWSPATSLNSFKKTLVFAKGAPDASIVLLGDSPGFEEERTGHPFMGKAGQKLDQILKAMGLSRSQVYITNVCKLRPALPGQTTNNRKPTAQEMAAWLPILEKELSIVQPQCIIALGATAAEGLLNLQKQLVGKLRGEWFMYQQIPVRVSYHPSYLLRNANNNSEKRKLWDDMLAVMDRVNLPVSDKQRAFFT